jgi:hypothetical protein
MLKAIMIACVFISLFAHAGERVFTGRSIKVNQSTSEASGSISGKVTRESDRIGGGPSMTTQYMKSVAPKSSRPGMLRFIF